MNDPVDEDYGKLVWISDSAESEEMPMWKLEFHSPPKLPIFIGWTIRDVNDDPLKVILVDQGTSSMSKLLGTLSIEVVLLRGDFPGYDPEDWTADQFERAVLGSRTLLTGKVINSV